MDVSSASMEILCFNDSIDDYEEQTHSPYFFVGYSAPFPTRSGMTTNKVFLKVWKAEEVKTRSVETD